MIFIFVQVLITPVIPPLINYKWIKISPALQSLDMDMTLATNPGLGGICAIWLTGTATSLAKLDILVGAGSADKITQSPMPTGSLRYGILRDGVGEPLDEVILAAPSQGERVLTGHGGTATACALLNFLTTLGFQEIPAADSLTNPNTPRIFLAADIITAEVDRLLPTCRTQMQAAILLTARQGLARRLTNLTTLSARERTQEVAALREGYEVAARYFRPLRLCLAGAPNGGKSSLLNRLLAADRALVNPAAGTTRDAVSEWIEIVGYAVLLTDTAGLRSEAGVVEQKAQESGLAALAAADVIVFLLDASRPLGVADYEAAAQVREIISKRTAVTANSSTLPAPRVLVVLNKADLPRRLSEAEGLELFPEATSCVISCFEENAADLVRAAVTPLLGGTWRGDPVPFNARTLARMRDEG